ncbi:MAG: hypothetical protein ABW185_19800 [Sedimenticola sp.]
MTRYPENGYHHMLFIPPGMTLITRVRYKLNEGIALGNDRFKVEVGKLTGSRLKPNKVGRPVGLRKNKEEV